MIPKNRGEEFSSSFFALGIFWGEVSRYAATPLFVALSPVHSEIVRFRQWSPCDRKSFASRRKNSKIVQTNGTFDVFDPLRGEFPHVQIFMDDEPNPLT